MNSDEIFVYTKMYFDGSEVVEGKIRIKYIPNNTK